MLQGGQYIGGSELLITHVLIGCVGTRAKFNLDVNNFMRKQAMNMGVGAG